MSENIPVIICEAVLYKQINGIHSTLGVVNAGPFVIVTLDCFAQFWASL